MPKARILIVEDEAIVAADLEDSLRNLGYEVCAVCSSAGAAIEQAQALGPNLVLMDIKLKGPMDGIDAAAAIREKLCIPVVYLTAHADEGTLERAKATDPAGYLLKPFEETELRIALELALHRYHSLVEKAEERGETPAPQAVHPEQPAESCSLDSSNTEGEALAFLRQIPPLAGLPDAGLQPLAAACHFRSYSAGQIIAHENDQTGQGFFVRSGRVAMLKTSPSGRQLIVELLPPGDLFGLALCINEKIFPLTGRAQTASQLLWVPRPAFRRFLEEHGQISLDLMSLMAERLRRSYSLSRALAHDRVDVRIASALVALLPRFGTFDWKRGTHKIPITRQELADLTGTSVETAIRITKNMERERLLDLSETGLVRIVNFDKLSELTEE